MTRTRLLKPLTAYVIAALAALTALAVPGVRQTSAQSAILTRGSAAAIIQRSADMQRLRSESFRTQLDWQRRAAEMDFIIDDRLVGALGQSVQRCPCPSLVPLRPLETPRVSVTGITSGDSERGAEFTWEYVAVPAPLRYFALRGGAGTASFRKYDDGWRLVAIQLGIDQTVYPLSASDFADIQRRVAAHQARAAAAAGKDAYFQRRVAESRIPHRTTLQMTFPYRRDAQLAGGIMVNPAGDERSDVLVTDAGICKVDHSIRAGVMAGDISWSSGWWFGDITAVGFEHGTIVVSTAQSATPVELLSTRAAAVDSEKTRSMIAVLRQSLRAWRARYGDTPMRYIIGSRHDQLNQARPIDCSGLRSPPTTSQTSSPRADNSRNPVQAPAERRVPGAQGPIAPVTIAVVTDMNGPYAAVSGPGEVAATRMAVTDFGGTVLGRPVEVVIIDHANDAVATSAKVRQAIDSGANVVLGMTNSGVALAATSVANEKHTLAVVTGAVTSALTGVACNKYTYHYAYDMYAMATATGRNLARQTDGKRWHAIVPNYAFGQQMLIDIGRAIEFEGASFIGTTMMPLGSTDFWAPLRRAKESNVDVVGLLGTGPDTVQALRTAQLYRSDGSIKHIAVGFMFITDVDANPDAYAGVRTTTSWYWNADQATRAWADRFTKVAGDGARPSEVQAADYSATTQWLNAVKAIGSTDADKIVAYLDARTFSDFYARNGMWRARDHRVVHDMYVVDVVPQAQLREPHAWFQIVETVAPRDAFRPEQQSDCTKSW